VIYTRPGGGDILARDGRYLKMALRIERLLTRHPVYQKHKLETYLPTPGM
jgi:hypothetical protein